MPTFKYIAKDRSGKQTNGSVVAQNESAALRTLTEQGKFPLEIKQDESLPFALGIAGGVRLSELVNFYNQLSDLLRAGVPMLRGLDILSKQNQRRKICRVIAELKEDVGGGASLADSMEKHPSIFPELHIGMVRAGEQGGFLEKVLRRLGIFVDQKDQLRNKIIGSMIYPIFLLIIALVVVVVLVTYFMPKLEPMFQGMELPALTVGVMRFGQILQKYFWLIIFAAVLLITMILPYIRSQSGRYKWHKLQLYLPVAGRIFRMVSICRFCRILGTLLGNGVPMINALVTSRESAGNMVMEEIIADGTESVREGKGLASALKQSEVFPADIVDMISVAEESNRLPEVLVEIAETQERRLSAKIDVAVRMLEPIMLLVVFGMVFVIAIALLLPILQMSMGAGL